MMDGGKSKILLGASLLVNPEHIRADINLKDIEEQMINEGYGTVESAAIRDPVGVFDDQLREVAQSVGLSLNDFKGDDDEDDDYVAPVASSKPTATSYASSAYSEKPSSYASAYPTDYSSSWTPPLQTATSMYNEKPQSYASYSAPSYTPSASSFYNESAKRPEVEQRTIEQRRRDEMRAVIHSGNNDMFSLEEVRSVDSKARMLSEIETLRDILMGENEQLLERVPEVNHESSHEEIAGVLRLLTQKNDTSRSCMFADEVFMFGANMLEDVFDGERTFFGRYKPDLRGWSPHVATKLRRMRFDTGRIAGSILNDCNLGPIGRILIELVPSALLYSNTRKKQHGQSSLYDDMAQNEYNDRL